MSGDWTRMRVDELEDATVRACTVGGTVVQGRLQRVVGPLDQMMFDGIFQPLLLRLPGEGWRLVDVWESLTILD